MREKVDRKRYLHFETRTDRKTVLEYRAQYARLSEVLEAVPGLLDAVHKDLLKLSDCHGKLRDRASTYTSEIMLRVLIVHELEATSLRDTEVRIAESETLREFCRLGTRDVPDHSFMDRCYGAIEPETWREVTRRLTKAAVERGEVNPEVVRTDATVVEANIHYPTDCSLLWDAYRVMTRKLREAKNAGGAASRAGFTTGR